VENSSDPLRLAAVQAPVIPIIGRWIADTPGTISLGQGMVGYGPVEGLPPLVDALAHKLRHENGIDVAAGSPVVVTAGGNLAFMNAMLAITDPGDDVLLPAPFYFNHEMAVVIAGARAPHPPSSRGGGSRVGVRRTERVLSSSVVRRGRRAGHDRRAGPARARPANDGRVVTRR
jgi:hypothetical protein